MPRGGKRLGAGRPAGSSVLDEWEVLEVAVECSRRWNADAAERLQGLMNAYFARSDYNVATKRFRASGFRDGEALEDIEYARREMAGMAPENEAEAPKGVRFEVAQRYGLKKIIIAEVAAWATARFGKQVSPGIVKSAWRVLDQVEADDV